MSSSEGHCNNEEAAAAAANWFVCLQATNVSREQQEAAADWLRRSPVHVEEFLRLTALYGELARLPELQAIDVDAELAKLARTTDTAVVVALGTPHADVVAGAERKPRIKVGSARRRILVGAAIAACVVLTLTAALLLHDSLGRQHYRTDIGEQRSLTLADGSQVQLNAHSQLTAKVNRTVREIRVEDGEVLFHVAKDPKHPFRVHTPQATIEAKGTEFNVRVSNGKTVVSLLEGRVLVTRNGPGQQSSTAGEAGVMLSPGQQMSVADRAGELPIARSTDVAAAVAWTHHRLVFDDATLSEVIEEFNRYNREPFVIHDAALGRMRITASFDSNSAQTFAESLAAAGGLRAVRQSSGEWLIERK
ncbi:MAG: FecR domain-containing protein [Proteobacteria bacterium]|nr:FecR domain-containing protein [Pseudomonadota bacterium]